MPGLPWMRLGLCLLLAVCALPSAASAEDPPAKLDFQLLDSKGIEHKLSDYRGRWVVLEWVNFSCRAVTRLYEKPTQTIPRLQRRFARKRVVWLSINTPGSMQSGLLTPSTATSALRSVGSHATALLLDSDGAVARTFGVHVTPEVRVISPLGAVVYAGGVEGVSKATSNIRHLELVVIAATNGRPIPYAARPTKGCRLEFPPPGIPEGPVAPQFAAFDSLGVLRRLSDYRGKWVILEWVNYDCRFVKKHYDLSHRNMQSLQRRAKQRGIVWLSICSSPLGQVGGLFPRQVNARMLQLGASPTAYLLDREGKIGRRYGARFTPEMRVINPRGEIVYTGGIDNRRSARPTDVLRAKNYIALALDAILANKPLPVRRSPTYGCRVKY